MGQNQHPVPRLLHVHLHAVRHLLHRGLKSRHGILRRVLGAAPVGGDGNLRPAAVVHGETVSEGVPGQGHAEPRHHGQAAQKIFPVQQPAGGKIKLPGILPLPGRPPVVNHRQRAVISHHGQGASHPDGGQHQISLELQKKHQLQPAVHEHHGEHGRDDHRQKIKRRGQKRRQQIHTHQHGQRPERTLPVELKASLHPIEKIFLFHHAGEHDKRRGNRRQHKRENHCCQRKLGPGLVRHAVQHKIKRLNLPHQLNNHKRIDKQAMNRYRQQKADVFPPQLSRKPQESAEQYPERPFPPVVSGRLEHLQKAGRLQGGQKHREHRHPQKHQDRPRMQEKAGQVSHSHIAVARKSERQRRRPVRAPEHQRKDQRPV